MKLVYIAHPFSAKQENVESVQRIILGLLHKHPDTTFYSPLHATGFFYNELPYEVGMEHCYEALRRCDELWLCPGWQDSRGCNLEVKLALDQAIPIRAILDGDIVTQEVHNGRIG